MNDHLGVYWNTDLRELTGFLNFGSLALPLSSTISLMASPSVFNSGLHSCLDFKQLLCKLKLWSVDLQHQLPPESFLHITAVSQNPSRPVQPEPIMRQEIVREEETPEVPQD